MLKLDLSRNAAKFTSTREPKHQRQIAARIQALREDPAPVDSKTLRDMSLPLSRVDIGEYRIIYRTEGDTVYVTLVGKRNDDEVYRRAKRK